MHFGVVCQIYWLNHLRIVRAALLMVSAIFRLMKDNLDAHDVILQRNHC